MAVSNWKHPGSDWGDILMKRVVLFVSLLLLASCASNVAAQTNWAERLGFPPGKRVVILHANDMGIAYEFNRPAEAGLQDGILTSASVMSAGPWFGECAEWAKANRDKDIGITLSFVSPSSAVQWGPVAPRDEVPSLTTVEGYFPSTRDSIHVAHGRRPGPARSRSADSNEPARPGSSPRICIRTSAPC